MKLLCLLPRKCTILIPDILGLCRRVCEFIYLNSFCGRPSPLRLPSESCFNTILSTTLHYKFPLARNDVRNVFFSASQVLKINVTFGPFSLHSFFSSFVFGRGLNVASSFLLVICMENPFWGLGKMNCVIFSHSRAGAWDFKGGVVGAWWNMRWDLWGLQKGEAYNELKNLILLRWTRNKYSVDDSAWEWGITFWLMSWRSDKGCFLFYVS